MAKGHKIRKILIPNRGEIAVRILRSCRELGIPAVAVYSNPDRNALHVRYADEAYPLNGMLPVETYLNQDLIIDIAKKCQADAIHPGYGFLSENAEFAQKCSDSNLVFIGPRPEAIELMGLKTTSRSLMIQAGIPVVPGTGDLGSFSKCQTQAAEIGYPLLVKAVAGGGGKGMRLVENTGELRKAFEAARREAQSSFGDSRVYMEKYLSRPRHVEFQILADLYGNIKHLYERECSVQRRHQKIIEETPSPFLDDRLRCRMGETAIAAARACRYTNVGTVEFLVDADRNFYFLEMNTRLQVEHPITEMVTGIDIVEQQIRIAEGEALSPDPVSRKGASMECRIYAEDPGNHFFPCPGLIRGLTDPAGPGVRNDSGVYNGYAIPMEYDPLISKLVAWGNDRKQVLDRMSRALEEFRILGVKTNISYLREIVNHPQFRSGDYDTLFIENQGNELLKSAKCGDEAVALFAAAVLTMTKGEKDRSIQDHFQEKVSNWKMVDRIRKSPR